HRKIVAQPPPANIPPTRLPAKASTRSVCPPSVPRQRPLASSHSLTVLTQPALASRLPTGEKASCGTQMRCPARVCTQVAGPLGGIAHSRIVPATSPLASRCPSGLQASEPTELGCGNASRRVPSFGFQSRTVASTPPL